MSAQQGAHNGINLSATSPIALNDTAGLTLRAFVRALNLIRRALNLIRIAYKQKHTGSLNCSG